MKVRQRIATAVMEKYGAISEEAGALADIYRGMNKAIDVLRRQAESLDEIGYPGPAHGIRDLVAELENTR